jgi:hypothetical protein
MQEHKEPRQEYYRAFVRNRFQLFLNSKFFPPSFIPTSRFPPNSQSSPLKLIELLNHLCCCQPWQNEIQSGAANFKRPLTVASIPRTRTHTHTLSLSHTHTHAYTNSLSQALSLRFTLSPARPTNGPRKKSTFSSSCSHVQ